MEEEKVTKEEVSKNIAAKKAKRIFLVRTKQCRQCGKPFSTTSNVQVVHPECRQEYYRIKAKEYSNTKGTNRPNFRERDRRKYFIKEKPCEACGYAKVTKERKFFHKEGESIVVKKHTLCLNCIMLYRFGLIEALTWKPLAA